MAKLDYNEDDIQFVMELTNTTKEKAEKYILEVYKDLEDDTINIFDVLDIIENEVKGKNSGIKNYVSSDKPKEKKTRERKVDDEKANILSWLQNGLWTSQKIECVRENEVKLHFTYNGSEYTVNLVKHRPKK